MGKATSYHPYRAARQRQMPEGMKPVGKSTGDPMREKAVGFPEDAGKSQPNDRSLGMRKVKNAMAKRGI